MAYDLDRTELNHLLTPGIDPGARAAVIDFLLKNGPFPDDDNDVGHGHHHDNGEHGRWDHHIGYDAMVNVQETYDGVHLDPMAQVLNLTTATNSITTDSALKVIVENVATNADLTIHGADDVMIMAGAGNDHIDLSDSQGDDLVLGGHGNDSVIGGEGADSIYGGGGNDTIHGGGGDHQLIVGGGGSDDLYGGSGADDSVYGGQGSDLIVGGSGNYQLLAGGDGSDTLWGGSGSHDTVMGGNGPDDIHGGIGAHQLLLGANGNDTMFGGVGDYDTVSGGDGNDLIHVADHANGHDTVDGGGGNDTLKLDGRSTSDLAPHGFNINHGEVTLHFNDGQTVAVNNVENIVFTDKTYHI
jgi:Ca2+-binding RTX toxin-like protein